MQEAWAGVASLLLQVLTLYTVVKPKVEVDTAQCCLEVFRDLEVTRTRLQELELRVSTQFVLNIYISAGVGVVCLLLILSLTCSGCGPCVVRTAKPVSKGSVIAASEKPNNNSNLVPPWKCTPLEHQLSTCPP